MPKFIRDDEWYTPRGAGFEGTCSLNFPPETKKYFSYHFKGMTLPSGKPADDTAFIVEPLLIEALESNDPSLTVLNCERRNLTDTDMKKVFKALAKNTTVTELKLRSNFIALEAGLLLAEVLKDNTTITKVDLKNNDLQNIALQGLAEMISVNETITELDLTANFAQIGVCEHIARALTMNTTLKTLILDNCQIDDAGAKPILEALPKTNITRFSGCTNQVLDKELRKKFRGFGK